MSTAIDELHNVLVQNAFELFGIPCNFELELTQLNNKLYTLQKKFHPDNWVNSEEQIASLITKVSSHINNCYQELKHPLARALLLLKIHDFTLDLTNDTQISPIFLAEQIELHELIDEYANDLDKLAGLELNIKHKQKLIITQLNDAFIAKQFALARDLTKQLAFYKRLIMLVANAIDKQQS
ncbi:MAG: Fe-S protein assembly co-chaperone HscB [Burkholderiales bacterium]|nr:Fe-S protein assembly co-chaperone HscB [Burkholderiales bacterium]